MDHQDNGQNDKDKALESEPEKNLQDIMEETTDSNHEMTDGNDGGLCPHCFADMQHEDSFCKNCGYPPAGFQDIDVKEDIALENVNKIEEIKHDISSSIDDDEDANIDEDDNIDENDYMENICLLYTSPSPRDS